MSFVSEYREQMISAAQTVDSKLVDLAIDEFRRALVDDRQIFVFGNGGSASTASHFVTDIVKSASHAGAKRFRVMALTDSNSTITAYANDLHFEYVFVEQLKNFARPGDLVVAITGSGNSRNVIRALEHATAHGCRRIALTGRDGGKTGLLADLHINVAEPHMGRIEDCHMMICHMIAYAFVDAAPTGAEHGGADATARVSR
jgi:D-sedoheptulose 7-phosphate isomerase